MKSIFSLLTINPSIPLLFSELLCYDFAVLMINTHDMGTGFQNVVRYNLDK